LTIYLRFQYGVTIVSFFNKITRLHTGIEFGKSCRRLCTAAGFVTSILLLVRSRNCRGCRRSFNQYACMQPARLWRHCDAVAAAAAAAMSESSPLATCLHDDDDHDNDIEAMQFVQA